MIIRHPFLRQSSRFAWWGLNFCEVKFQPNCQPAIIKSLQSVFCHVQIKIKINGYNDGLRLVSLSFTVSWQTDHVTRNKSIIAQWSAKMIENRDNQRLIHSHSLASNRHEWEQSAAASVIPPKPLFSYQQCTSLAPPTCYVTDHVTFSRITPRCHSLRFYM